MPTYRFDIQDDDSFIAGEDSFDLADDQKARSEAMKAAGDMMAEAMPNGDHKQLTVLVRRDDGQTILTVSLSRWMRAGTNSSTEGIDALRS